MCGLVNVVADPQHGVIDLFVAIGVNRYGRGHDDLYFVCHHAELPNVSTTIAELGLVIEQVKADTERMGAYPNNVFLGGPVGLLGMGIIGVQPIAAGALRQPIQLAMNNDSGGGIRLLVLGYFGHVSVFCGISFFHFESQFNELNDELVIIMFGKISLFFTKGITAE